MSLVRRESLAEQAADLLLSRIRDGEWNVGDKLPGETTLAPALGVGRSTVREAIRQLAGQGVLVSRQGAGVFVTALDIPENWDAVLHRADIVAVIEARIAIEVEASALAAERRTPEELEDLRRALTDRAHHRVDVEKHVDTDMAFHRGILRAAHSPILLELFTHFAPRNRRAMVDMLRDRGDHGDDADQATHERIYDAIDSRDAGLAATLTRTHLNTLKELLIR